MLTNNNFSHKILPLCIIVLVITFWGCSQPHVNWNDAAIITDSSKQVVNLPPPYASKSVRNYCKVVGWQPGQTPIAPAGFKVSLFAGGLDNPRNIYVANNGNVFVSQANTEIKGIEKIGAEIIGATKSEDLDKSANNILLFRDTNGDGIPDTKTVFLSGLNQPFGMLIIGNYFYVANTDGVWRYAYKVGQYKITTKGQLIMRFTSWRL